MDTLDIPLPDEIPLPSTYPFMPPEKSSMPVSTASYSPPPISISLTPRTSSLPTKVNPPPLPPLPKVSSPLKAAAAPKVPSPPPVRPTKAASPSPVPPPLPKSISPPPAPPILKTFTPTPVPPPRSSSPPPVPPLPKAMSPASKQVSPPPLPPSSQIAPPLPKAVPPPPPPKAKSPPPLPPPPPKSPPSFPTAAKAISPPPLPPMELSERSKKNFVPVPSHPNFPQSVQEETVSENPPGVDIFQDDDFPAVAPKSANKTLLPNSFPKAAVPMMGWNQYPDEYYTWMNMTGSYMDSSKYSPSRVTEDSMEDDHLYKAKTGGAMSPPSMKMGKNAHPVLGKDQAKKRLMAFSVAKQTGGMGLSFGFLKTKKPSTETPIEPELPKPEKIEVKVPEVKPEPPKVEKPPKPSSSRRDEFRRNIQEIMQYELNLKAQLGKQKISQSDDRDYRGMDRFSRSGRKRSRSRSPRGDRKSSERQNDELPESWSQMKYYNTSFDDIRRIKRNIDKDRRARRRSRSRSRDRKRRSRSGSRRRSKSPYERGRLLHPLLARGIKKGFKEYPGNMIRRTKANPEISYCENPLVVPGYYKTRAEVFSEESKEIQAMMEDIMHSRIQIAGGVDAGEAPSVHTEYDDFTCFLTEPIDKKDTEAPSTKLDKDLGFLNGVTSPQIDPKVKEAVKSKWDSDNEGEEGKVSEDQAVVNLDEYMNPSTYEDTFAQSEFAEKRAVTPNDDNEGNNQSYMDESSELLNDFNVSYDEAVEKFNQIEREQATRDAVKDIIEASKAKVTKSYFTKQWKTSENEHKQSNSESDKEESDDEEKEEFFQPKESGKKETYAHEKPDQSYKFEEELSLSMKDELPNIKSSPNIEEKAKVVKSRERSVDEDSGSHGQHHSSDDESKAEENTNNTETTKNSQEKPKRTKKKKAKASQQSSDTDSDDEADSDDSSKRRHKKNKNKKNKKVKKLKKKGKSKKKKRKRARSESSDSSDDESEPQKKKRKRSSDGKKKKKKQRKVSISDSDDSSSDSEPQKTRKKKKKKSEVVESRSASPDAKKKTKKKKKEKNSQQTNDGHMDDDMEEKKKKNKRGRSSSISKNDRRKKPSIEDMSEVDSDNAAKRKKKKKHKKSEESFKKQKKKKEKKKKKLREKSDPESDVSIIAEEECQFPLEKEENNTTKKNIEEHFLEKAPLERENAAEELSPVDMSISSPDANERNSEAFEEFSALNSIDKNRWDQRSKSNEITSQNVEPSWTQNVEIQSKWDTVVESRWDDSESENSQSGLYKKPIGNFPPMPVAPVACPVPPPQGSLQKLSAKTILDTSEKAIMPLEDLYSPTRALEDSSEYSSPERPAGGEVKAATTDYFEDNAKDGFDTESNVEKSKHHGFRLVDNSEDRIKSRPNKRIDLSHFEMKRVAKPIGMRIAVASKVKSIERPAAFADEDDEPSPVRPAPKFSPLYSPVKEDSILYNHESEKETEKESTEPDTMDEPEKEQPIVEEPEDSRIEEETHQESGIEEETHQESVAVEEPPVEDFPKKIERSRSKSLDKKEINEKVGEKDKRGERRRSRERSREKERRRSGSRNRKIKRSRSRSRSPRRRYRRSRSRSYDRRRDRRRSPERRRRRYSRTPSPRKHSRRSRSRDKKLKRSKSPKRRSRSRSVEKKKSYSSEKRKSPSRYSQSSFSESVPPGSLQHSHFSHEGNEMTAVAVDTIPLPEDGGKNIQKSLADSTISDAELLGFDSYWPSNKTSQAQRKGGGVQVLRVGNLLEVVPSAKVSPTKSSPAKSGAETKTEDTGWVQHSNLLAVPVEPEQKTIEHKVELKPTDDEKRSIDIKEIKKTLETKTTEIVESKKHNPEVIQKEIKPVEPGQESQTDADKEAKTDVSAIPIPPTEAAAASLPAKAAAGSKAALEMLSKLYGQPGFAGQSSSGQKALEMMSSLLASVSKKSSTSLTLPPPSSIFSTAKATANISNTLKAETPASGDKKPQALSNTSAPAIVPPPPASKSTPPKPVANIGALLETLNKITQAQKPTTSTVTTTTAAAKPSVTPLNVHSMIQQVSSIPNLSPKALQLLETLKKALPALQQSVARGKVPTKKPLHEVIPDIEEQPEPLSEHKESLEQRLEKESMKKILDKIARTTDTQEENAKAKDSIDKIVMEKEKKRKEREEKKKKKKAKKSKNKEEDEPPPPPPPDSPPPPQSTILRSQFPVPLPARNRPSSISEDMDLEDQILMREAMEIDVDNDQEMTPPHQSVSDEQEEESKKKKKKKKKDKNEVNISFHLPAPPKGILVSAGFGEKTLGVNKLVMFADGVKPGEGASPDTREGMHSPPPPPRQHQESYTGKHKKRIRVTRKCNIEVEDDDEDDAPLPPESPPVIPSVQQLPAGVQFASPAFLHPATAIQQAVLAGYQMSQQGAVPLSNFVQYGVGLPSVPIVMRGASQGDPRAYQQR